ncbi:MAG TPA: GMC oxidoreductase, partial [Actinomycetota bacterium]|nr:GMC oxidoreductase [Actinomycetota bacterium]
GFPGDAVTGPWDSAGKTWGDDATRFHEEFSHALCVLVCVDDEEHPDNRVALDPDYGPDENGRVPLVSYRGTAESVRRREWLSVKAAEILRAAGARHIHRSDLDVYVSHPMGTMRMGGDPRTSMVNERGEAHEVPGLFIADNSVFPNGLGGPNPTLTCQALATRTADAVAARYV